MTGHGHMFRSANKVPFGTDLSSQFPKEISDFSTAIHELGIILTDFFLEFKNDRAMEIVKRIKFGCKTKVSHFAKSYLCINGIFQHVWINFSGSVS